MTHTSEITIEIVIETERGNLEKVIKIHEQNEFEDAD